MDLMTENNLVCRKIRKRVVFLIIGFGNFSFWANAKGWKTDWLLKFI